MARLIKDFEPYRGRAPYPSEWFDGASRKLTEKDFNSQQITKGKINSLRRAAARMGMSLTVRQHSDGSVDIRAIKPKTKR